MSFLYGIIAYVMLIRLYDMSKLGLIPPFDINIDKCKTCMLNKITRNHFHRVEIQSVFLELVHSDLCDFHSTPSLRNKKNILSLLSMIFHDIVTYVCYLLKMKPLKI